MSAPGAMGARQGGPGHAMSLLLRLVAGVVGLFFVATVIVLTLAFLIGVFGANTNTEFASWIISHAQTPARPFDGLFPSWNLFGDSQLNLSLLAAIVVYTVVGGALASLFNWFSNMFNS